MALYFPDVEYLEAKKVVKNLGKSKKDQAIKYYIEKQEEEHNKTIEELNKYKKFFETLNKLLPKDGGILG